MDSDDLQIIKLSQENNQNLILEKNQQNYKHFMNTIYQTAKEKQSAIKKSSLGQLPSSFPKISLKDLTVPYNDSALIPNQSQIPKPRSTASSSRAKVFRSFINQIDQQQKKINIQTMGLLGLQVKKLQTTQKCKKRFSEKYDALFQSPFETYKNQYNIYNAYNEYNTLQQNTTQQTKQNAQSLQSNDMSKYNPIDLLCKKIDISKRDIPIQKMNQTIYHKNSFRMKQRVSLLTPPSTLEKRRIISSRKASSKQGKNEDQQKKKNKIIVNPEFINPIYQGRITKYRQFIFKMNYVYNIFIDITKYDEEEVQFALRNENKFKAYIGPGNNCKLIKNLIKRRFWWTIEQKNKINQCNFVWTQLRHNQYFKKQTPSNFNAYSVDINSMLESSQNLQRSTSASPVKRKKVFKRQKQSFQDRQHFNKIFTDKQIQLFCLKIQKNQNKTYVQKSQLLKLKQFNSKQQKMHNHLINNFYLGNKKALFYNLKQYYELIDQNPFKRIPLTFHIKKGLKDLQYKRFISYYKKRQVYMKQQQKQMEKGQIIKRKMRNIWIVKPGELTNRGNGITVIDQIYQLNSIINKQGKHQNGIQKTFIVQLYIDRPFLYQKRKFDLRHYVLVTHLHGIMRAYWFTEGYIRTCSYEFDIDNFERQIHLTNDAVQKYTPLYGRYEAGNKISYSDFQKYLDTNYPKKHYNFQKIILSQMKEITIDAIKSSYLKLSPQRLKHNFEIFGMDFMIDCDFKPWLIQINTNPCLQLCCPLLSRLIPQMLDQSFRLSLDLIYPPPCHYPNTSKHLAPQAGLQNLKYQLIFDQKRDGAQIRSLYKQHKNNLLEDIGEVSQDQVYEDDGKDIALDEILM